MAEQDRPDRDDLERAHTPEAIRQRLSALPEHSYLRDFVYGAVDGAVTTFAVAAGAEGASLSPGIVLVLGLANLVADGFSMAAGNFLGVRAAQAERRSALRTEELHIKHYPDGEREEVRQIFARKGFSGDDLERVVEVITSDRRQWVETMLREELGLPARGPSPGRAAASTFAAFVLAGLVPLLPYLLARVVPALLPAAFVSSAVLTGAAFFLVGALKGRFVAERWHLAGLETLLVGGSAAVLAYVVGLLLRSLVGT
ncbi:MAG TPA: VIT1/CCC1 transporter family protein [Planctomycetota bacterium]|nr:VIT1/CCC1 transporter family protein [Planctomycetota bacterium]